MLTKFFSATSKTKRHINANDKSAIMTVAVAVVLLGAFFIINPINLTAFAAVDPDEVKNTTGFDGPIHPGTFLTVKNVTFTNSTDDLLTITPAVNVTFSVVNEGTDQPCIDLTSQVILNLTTTNTTTNIDPVNYTKSLFYDETFVGMPGVYHCNVLFIAANVTTASDTTLIGNQTVWIDAIGTLGFWKNHANATEQHLPITLGNFVVGDNETATDIFKSHKGKLNLDKVAAQLLAAALNVWALDMGTNSSKTDCINATITFTNETIGGPAGDYNGPGNNKQNVNKNSPFSEGLKMNHTLLDNFNNNGC